MYKFEISADTPEELRDKQLEFASDLLGTQHKIEQTPTHIPEIAKPEYVDEVEEQIPLIPATTLQAVTQALAPAIPGGVTPLDSRGFPWDERIHASTKNVTMKGEWKYKRGVDDALINQVEKELITAMNAQPVNIPVIPQSNLGLQPSPVSSSQIALVPAAPLASPLPTYPNTAPVANTQADPNFFAPIAQVVNPAATPAAPLATAPVPTRPAHSLGSFKQNLNMLLAQLVVEKKITPEYVQQLKDYFKVKEIWNVLSSEAQCIELYNTFGELGFITRMD